MKKISFILVLALFAIFLLSFIFKINSSNNSIAESNKMPSNSLNAKVEKKLKQQAIEQFNLLVDYDLEALDEYAPKDEEMEAYYKIFDENAFQEKYNFFAKNYASQGMNYGEDAFYDRDLIMRISSRASVLRSRSNIMNSEQIKLNSEDIELKEVFVQKNEDQPELYDLHVRFFHPEKMSLYEFVNEACWLTDRTCINTLGWKFLGRYNQYTNQHSFSQLNLKNL